MHLEMLSAKWRPLCLGLNVLSWRVRSPCIRIPVGARNPGRTRDTESSPKAIDGVHATTWRYMQNRGCNDAWNVEAVARVTVKVPCQIDGNKT